MAMDISGFTGIGQGSRTSGQVTDYAWWRRDAKEAADSVSAVIQTLVQQQRIRLRRLYGSARLYGNVGVFGRVGPGAARTVASTGDMSERLAYNVIQSGIDTLQSKIGKNNPEPFFLTSDGNYHQRRRAKKLNRFMRGIFYEEHAYEVGKMCLRDGFVWGDGLNHIFARDNKVKYERVFPSEIFVDEVEGFDGKPMCLHWIREADRGVAFDMFPGAKNRAIIEKSNRLSFDDTIAPQQTSDVIAIRQSWRLPSGKDSKDGRTLISTDAGPLEPEGMPAMMPWVHQRFPFARFTFNPRLSGFWGHGIPEQVETIQYAIYDLLRLIQKCHRLMGTPKILMEMGSQIAKAAFNNEVGTIIKYQKTPPTYLTHQIVSQELYAWIVTLKQLAYDQMGISQLSATAQKPAGLNSGKALREYNDIESERFMVPGQRYEQFFLDTTEYSLDVVRDIIKQSGDEDYVVTVPDRRDAMKLSWKDVSLDDFVTQCYPISSLPNSPAGRMQTVQEWVQAGWIDQDDAQRLLNFPDLAQRDSLRSAAEEYALKCYDRMVDDGLYTPPDPYNDLNKWKTLGFQYYNEGLLYGLEEERLALIRKALKATQRLMTPPMPQVPGAPPAGMPQPNAPPVPPQPGELVPNTPQQPQSPMPMAA